MKKSILSLLIGVFTYLSSFCQVDSVSLAIRKNAKEQASEKTQQAQKDKTGNTKDVLPNLYQMALKNIFGKSGELSVNTTVFGLLNQIDDKIQSSTLYPKYRWARNLTINIEGKLDSANSKVQSYGGGLKIAIINKRDITKFDSAFNLKMQEYETKLGKLRSSALISLLETNHITNDDAMAKKQDEINASIEKFLQSKNVSDLDQDFLLALKSVSGEANPEELFLKPLNYAGDWANSLNSKPLWTFNYNLYHNTATKKDTSAFQTDFVAGFKLRKDKTDEKLWELNLSSYLKLCKTTDSTNKTSSLFHFEAGLNKVLSTDGDKKSQMELKLFGSYDKDFAVDNRKGIVTANITYRYRAFKDFWIPVSLKYDPKNGNVFGYLTFALNLDKY